MTLVINKEQLFTIHYENVWAHYLKSQGIQHLSFLFVTWTNMSFGKIIMSWQKSFNLSGRSESCRCP